MRVIAGIVLMLAAVLNALTGGLYLLGGGVAASGIRTEQVRTEADLDQAVKDGQITTLGAVAGKAQATWTAAAVQVPAQRFFIFGVVLWVMFVLQMVAVILLFVGRGRIVIALVAVLSIATEITGMVLSASLLTVQWSALWKNVPGLAGGLLALIGAMRLRRDPARPAASV